MRASIPLCRSRGSTACQAPRSSSVLDTIWRTCATSRCHLADSECAQRAVYQIRICEEVRECTRGGSAPAGAPAATLGSRPGGRASVGWQPPAKRARCERPHVHAPRARARREPRRPRPACCRASGGRGAACAGLGRGDEPGCEAHAGALANGTAPQPRRLDCRRSHALSSPADAQGTRSSKAAWIALRPQKWNRR
jgi:hypothetical protein